MCQAPLQYKHISVTMNAITGVRLLEAQNLLKGLHAKKHIH